MRAASTAWTDAGIRTGDLLVRADGHPLLSCLDLAESAAEATTGTPTLTVDVVRGEQERRVQIALEPRTSRDRAATP